MIDKIQFYKTVLSIVKELQLSGIKPTWKDVLDVVGFQPSSIKRVPDLRDKEVTDEFCSYFVKSDIERHRYDMLLRLSGLSLPNEHWQKCPISDNYMISDLGRVYSLWNGVVMKQQIGSKGNGHRHKYYRVIIDGKQMKVHRLVALAFVPNDYPGLRTDVNHINENRYDNRACNLEWVTPLENTMKYIDNHKGT